MTDLTIVPENIQALGPIYEPAMLEEMQAFDVADRLLELHQQGLLPVGRPGAGDVLDEHWKRSRARVSKADRQRAAVRAFGFASGDDAGIAPNREFNDLWMRFVSSVSAFARELTVDAVRPGPSQAARQERVRKAARDLAANLSQHGYGLANFEAVDLQRQIDDLIKVLSDPEIRRAYGARDVTQLVDRVSALELGGLRAQRFGHLARARTGAIVIAWLAWRSPVLGAPGNVLDAATIKGKAGDKDPSRTPSDFDLVEACELWLAVSGVPDDHIDELSTPVETPEAREAVRSLLSKSAAYARLAPPMQSRIARDTIAIADHLVPGQADLIQRVDFPKFVTDLVTGVFQATVDASIKQMEAYADLVAAVAASVREFADENVSDGTLREHLCDGYPPLCDPPTREEQQRLAAAIDALAGGTWRRLAKARQQLLATMVLMGVNRSVGSHK
jgi:hypothetical protein